MLVESSQSGLSIVTYTKQDVNLRSERDSQQSPFHTCILLCLLNYVGDHESVLEDSLSDINFAGGWNGPPVAVAAHDDEIYHRLGEGVFIVEKSDYGDLGALDGHTRMHVAKIEGLTYIIGQLFPLIHPNILISTWLHDFQPLTPDEVRGYFKKNGETVQAKATKFQVIHKDGTTVSKISSIQPDVVAPRSVLMGETKES